MSNHDKWNEMQNSMQQLIFHADYKRVDTDFPRQIVLGGKWIMFNKF